MNFMTHSSTISSYRPLQEKKPPLSVSQSSMMDLTEPVNAETMKRSENTNNPKDGK